MDKHVINQYSYQTNNSIGKGYSSIVYSGLNNETGQKVAVKVIANKAKKGKVHQLLIESEIEICKKLKGKNNILHIYDVQKQQDKTYIISQLCDQDLDKLLKKKILISESQAIQYMKQIIKGYQHIWSLGVLHRDLKPANIFMKNNQPKIADFGFAIYAQQVKKFSTYNVGSPLYMSPQTLQYNIYNYKNDIWALGIIFFELLTGHTPWTSIKSEKDLLKQMKTKSIKKLIPKTISSLCANFLIKTIEPCEQLRMEPEQLVKYNFIAEEKPIHNTLIFEHKLQRRSSQFDNKISNIRNTLKSIEKSFDLSKNNSKSQQHILKYKYLTHTKQSQSREQNYKKNQSLNKKSTEKSLSKQQSSSIVEKLQKNIQALKSRKKISQLGQLTNKYLERQKNYKQYQHRNLKSVKNLKQQIKQTIERPQKLYAHNQPEKITNLLLSQIHLCRFSYKLFHLHSQFSSEQFDYHINKQIYGLIMFKLNEIKCLSLVKDENIEIYRQTKDYKKLCLMVSQYEEKYNKCFDYIKPSWQSYRHLQTCIKKKIQQMYFQIKDQQINSQREKIILLDLMVTFIQLLELSKSEKSDTFIPKEQMQAITDGKPAKLITKEHFSLLEKKLKTIL